MKRDIAWNTAARMAAMAEEADNERDREYFARMRDAYISLANQCEFLTDEQVPITATSRAHTRG
jgi:hypothetical protein